MGECTKKRASRAKKLAAMPVAERNCHIEQLKEAGKGVTPNAVLAASRKGAALTPANRRAAHCADQPSLKIDLSQILARKRKSLARNNKPGCKCSGNEGSRGDF
jgi:hypothetical protein